MVCVCVCVSVRMRLCMMDVCVCFYFKSDKRVTKSPEWNFSSHIPHRQWQRMYAVCMTLMHFQSVPYAYEAKPAIANSFQEFDHLSENQLYTMSLHIEPRNATFDDLEWAMPMWLSGWMDEWASEWVSEWVWRFSTLNCTHLKLFSLLSLLLLLLLSIILLLDCHWFHLFPPFFSFLFLFFLIFYVFTLV